MIIFNLPDLGEGLPDAVIREWYVKPGDVVKADQPLASMETAKALVDVPSPHAGEIAKCFGEPGDTIETGQPLVAFVSKDSGSVPAEKSEKPAPTAKTGSGSSERAESSPVKASPAVRALAKKLGVNLADLAAGDQPITAAQVEQAAAKPKASKEGFAPLSPVRRAMALSMTESRKRVSPITLSDDADVSAWDAQQNITIRLIRAVVAACQAVPILNATFDDENMSIRLNPEVNLGLAVDTEHGLYVPVIKNSGALTDKQLREKIDQYKEQARQKSLPQADLHGATITLSNFGSLAGRYGNPIIVPPMVAIIGVGKARDAVVAANGKPAIHRVIPLSITIDHRAATGGEAARFLKTMLDDLAK